jgi:hypothetical protein
MKTTKTSQEMEKDFLHALALALPLQANLNLEAPIKTMFQEVK